MGLYVVYRSNGVLEFRPFQSCGSIEWAELEAQVSSLSYICIAIVVMPTTSYTPFSKALSRALTHLHLARYDLLLVLVVCCPC